MYYYTAPSTGTGTASDPIQPKVPADVSWVGAYNAASGTYLIASPTPPTPANLTHVPDSDLPAVCAKRGLNVNDVRERWRC